jgi:hypothetical protein
LLVEGVEEGDGVVCRHSRVVGDFLSGCMMGRRVCFFVQAGKGDEACWATGDWTCVLDLAAAGW